SLTSPAFFGGLGMTLVSTPYSMWTTAAYAISTGVSIYNDLRASPSNGSERATTDQQARGLFSRLLHSPGFLYGVSGVVALAQGSSLLAQGNPLTAFAYGCVCVGSLALAALVNRQAGYAA